MLFSRITLSLVVTSGLISQITIATANSNLSAKEQRLMVDDESVAQDKQAERMVPQPRESNLGNNKPTGARSSPNNGRPERQNDEFSNDVQLERQNSEEPHQMPAVVIPTPTRSDIQTKPQPRGLKRQDREKATISVIESSQDSFLGDSTFIPNDQGSYYCFIDGICFNQFKLKSETPFIGNKGRENNDCRPARDC